MPPGLTRSSDMAEKQVAFFDHFFGNSPDGPIRPIPTQPTAPRVPGGVNLGDALKRIGGRGGASRRRRQPPGRRHT